MDLIDILHTSLSDFDDTITIVAPEVNDGKLRTGGSTDDQGYRFNQKDTVDLIDLYYNSKFKKGSRDTDGKRKQFLNKVKFAQNVAEKQTDVDVANYTFIPDEVKDSNKVWFIKKKFIVWTRENNYGQLLNDLNKDFSKYGSCVLRKRKNEIERIPIRQLKNTQDASSLKNAPIEGGYVIIEHQLSFFQMKEMPDWDTDDIEKFTGTKTVYEMYTLIEKCKLEDDNEDESNSENEDESKDEELVLSVSYISEEIQREDTTDPNPILFKEEIDEVPLEESHWDKQDGRWLGMGVVEDLFENQIAANMTANLRRKHLEWGAKKLFQTHGDAVVKNLVKEVEDGQVLEVGNKGEIVQIATESRNLAEFAQSDQTWDQNTEQKSFTFEVATGESLPSGTPFRLGVVLSRATAKYFDLKRENFGLFLYRSFFSQLMPIFKKETNEHTLAVANGEDGVEFIKESVIAHNTLRRFNKELLAGNIPTWDVVQAEVIKQIDKKAFMFVNIPKGYYDDAQFYMQLDITGEEESNESQMATLTTLYQTLAATNPQDPRLPSLLNQIVALTGNNPNKVLGSEEVRQEVTQGGGTGLPSAPQLQGLGQTPDVGV